MVRIDEHSGAGFEGRAQVLGATNFDLFETLFSELLPQPKGPPEAHPGGTELGRPPARWRPERLTVHDRNSARSFFALMAPHNNNLPMVATMTSA